MAIPDTLTKIAAIQITLSVRQIWSIIFVLGAITSIFVTSTWQIMRSASKVKAIVESAWTVQDMDSYGREWAAINGGKVPDPLIIYQRNRLLSAPAKSTNN